MLEGKGPLVRQGPSCMLCWTQEPSALSCLSQLFLCLAPIVLTRNTRVSPKSHPCYRLHATRVPVLQSAGKGVRAGLIKCGQCKTCLNPQMKKPCLNPIMQPEEGLVGSEGSCSK